MRFRHLILCASFLVTGSHDSFAQSWPTRQPIRLILPFSPGSSLDLLGRPVFEHVSKQIGQSFIFEHRPGAGGTLGMGTVAKALPDGYTLLLNSSVHTITPSTYAKLPYDTMGDLAGIIPLGQFPNVLVVPLGGHQSVQALVDDARTRADSVTYGSGGVGGAVHLNAERFRLSAGFSAVHVPFKGAPDVLREIVGGRLDFAFSPLSSAIPLIESNQVRALAVSSVQRTAALPDVPTTIEAGFPNSEYIFWIGAFAPRNTPQEIISRLHGEIANALNNPGVKEGMKKLAADQMVMTSAEFDSFIRDEIAKNAQLVRAAGIVPN